MANRIKLSSTLYAGQDIASIELTRREGAGGYTITREKLLEKGDGTMPAGGLIIDPVQYDQAANDIYGTWTVTYLNDCIHYEEASGATADCIIIGASLNQTTYYEGQPITVAEGQIDATEGFTFEGFVDENGTIENGTIDYGTTQLQPTFTVPENNGEDPYENQGELLTCPPLTITVAQEVDCPSLLLDSNLNNGDAITLSDLSGNNTTIYDVDLTDVTFQIGVTTIEVPVSIPTASQTDYFFELNQENEPVFETTCEITVRATTTFDCSDLLDPQTVVLEEGQFDEIGNSMESFITYNQEFVTSSGISITWPVWELGNEVSYDIEIDLDGTGLYYNNLYENGGNPVICNVTGTACKDDLTTNFVIDTAQA